MTHLYLLVHVLFRSHNMWWLGWSATFWPHVKTSKLSVVSRQTVGGIVVAQK